MANEGLRCYHHCNCSDRPAVATCSKCGKGLCVECADKLKSRTTGKLLCVDCMNAELAENAAIANAAKRVVTREMIFMLIGIIVGVIGFAIIFTIAESPYVQIASIWLPFVLASLWTIIKFIAELDLEHFLSKVLWFIILAAVSPLMFLWRIIRRIIDIVSMKRFATAQNILQIANSEYFELARSMDTQLDDAETYKKKIAELEEIASRIMKAQQESDAEKSKVHAATRIRPERETTRVGSGKRAA